MEKPAPPKDLLESVVVVLRPAPEVWDWVTDQILAATGSIHNEKHAHLLDANIGVLWASSGFAKQGRVVLGQAYGVLGILVMVARLIVQKKLAK